MRTILIGAVAVAIAGCPGKQPNDAGTPDGGCPTNNRSECLVSADTPGFGCGQPIQLFPLADGGDLRVTGSTTGFDDLFRCNIGAHGSNTLPDPDVVYYVNVPPRVHVTVTAEGGTRLSRSPSCPGACSDPLSGGATLAPSVDENPWNGAWPLFVEAPGDYVFHVHADPAPPLPCQQDPVPVPKLSRYVAHATGSTASFVDGGCADFGLFTVHSGIDGGIEGPQLSVAATIDGVPAPVQWLGESPCLAGDWSSCSVPPPTTTFSELVTGGDHYFLVAGPAGQHTYDVLVIASPADLCARATPLVLDAGYATFSGDLSNEPDSGCSPAKLFQFQTGVPRLGTVSTTAGEIQWVGEQCSWASCDSPPRQSSPISFSAVPGSELFTVVGPPMASFPFTVTVAAPALCDQPATLSFSPDGGSRVAEVTGSTGAGVLGGGPGCATTSAPAVAYVFTTAMQSDLDARLATSDGTFQPALALRTDCNGADSSCDQAAIAGATAHLAVTGLPAGTYSLVVGGSGQTGGGGSYTLTVSLTP